MTNLWLSGLSEVNSMGPASGKVGGGGESHKQALIFLLRHFQMELYIQTQRCYARVELSCSSHNIAGKILVPVLLISSL